MPRRHKANYRTGGWFGGDCPAGRLYRTSNRSGGDFRKDQAMRSIESKIERIERQVADEHRDFDGDDEPQFMRIEYIDFYGNANKLPAAVQEQMADWPDEELIEVR